MVKGDHVRYMKNTHRGVEGIIQAFSEDFMSRYARILVTKAGPGAAVGNSITFSIKNIAVVTPRDPLPW